MAVAKKYSLQDLKIGMQVKLSELQNILDIPMILIDTQVINNDDLTGAIVFFGNNEKEYEKWCNQTKPITPIYFDSQELEDGVVYDE